STPAVVFTNTRDVGSLTVSKEVTGNGGETDQDFRFTVTLENEDVEVNNTYDGVTFTAVNGNDHVASATFTLKHGEKKELTGIPAGTTYTVAEDGYTADGYETSRVVTG